MANIYEEKTEDLYKLLDRARSDDGATVLIPDLQRPYVWTPNQVALLMDSLIRGWPFGTLLMWKVGQGDLQNIPHRQFWRVVDRTEDGDSTTITRKDPPASYHMVLDGQQRVQSLLLALGGDSWGFKLEDRDWAQELQERRPRGRRGKYKHWSRACLCFDLDRFIEDYNAGGGLLAVDFRNVLQWAITDPVEGQSKWKKPDNYEEPLLKAQEPANQGRFVRLSRLWGAAAPNPNLKETHFRDIVRQVFEDEGVPQGKIDALLGPMGELMTTLRDVKLSKVTYLELLPFDEHIWTEDVYNDAIVNIFTRLNTAGRTLTREEITLAWLKVGWDSQATAGHSAGECFAELLTALCDRGLDIHMDDLVGAVSFVWSVRFNKGQLLANRDLLRGTTIRPMASELSRQWASICRAAVETLDMLNARELSFGLRNQYSSVNALAVLWAWKYLAVLAETASTATFMQKDAFRKKVDEVLAQVVDRWLLCSQWAGRWAGSSNKAIAGYAADLGADVTAILATKNLDSVVDILSARWDAILKDLVTDATNYVNALETLNRERVSVYSSALWVWHRLDAVRWQKSKIQLRVGKSKKTSVDVDHVVAYQLWNDRVNAASFPSAEEKQESLSVVNRLGNCSLLDKSFNISKSDKPLAAFLDEVHEFKSGVEDRAAWAAALKVPDSMMDGGSASLDEAIKAITERDGIIRAELIEFIKGQKRRTDV